MLYTIYKVYIHITKAYMFYHMKYCYIYNKILLYILYIIYISLRLKSHMYSIQSVALIVCEESRSDTYLGHQLSHLFLPYSVIYKANVYLGHHLINS